MKFSVALTTFRSEAFLGVQLDSLLAQTRKPDELVVCDDGSTDSTMAILEKFRAGAPFPVRIFRNEKNLGYAQNFAKAISLAEGDWIFLSDHDDRWHAEKLARFAEEIQRQPGLAAVFSDSALVDNALRPMGCSLFSANRFHDFEREYIHRGEAWRTFLRHNVAAGHALAIRADQRTAFLPIPPGWVHDAWIATVLAAEGKMAFLEDRLVDYRQHSHQHIGVIAGGIRQRLQARWNRIGTRAALAQEAKNWKALAENPYWKEKPSAMLELRKKISWLEGRSRLPRFFLFRAPFLFLKAPLYFRFDNGWQTILKDFFIR